MHKLTSGFVLILVNWKFGILWKIFCFVACHLSISWKFTKENTRLFKQLPTLAGTRNWLANWRERGGGICRICKIHHLVAKQIPINKIIIWNLHQKGLVNAWNCQSKLGKNLRIYRSTITKHYVSLTFTILCVLHLNCFLD